MSAEITAFYRKVYALEREASERYAELADQMEVHNNREVAELFRKLAGIEGRHAKQILDRAQRQQIKLDGAVTTSWLDGEGPETTPFGEVHYLMTPHHALFLALRNEERAVEYFQRIAEAGPADVRALAAEIVAEEREHVAMVRALIAKHPPPEALWSDDPDPPVYSE